MNRSQDRGAFAEASQGGIDAMRQCWAQALLVPLAWQTEAAQFLSLRMSRNLDTWGRALTSQTGPQLMELQSAWLGDATRDYNEYFSKLMTVLPQLSAEPNQANTLDRTMRMWQMAFSGPLGLARGSVGSSP